MAGGEQREASTRSRARPALVGRELELRAVRRFLEADEPSRALLVAGRPGIGKTTLWQAALAAAAERGMAVLAARPRAAEAKAAQCMKYDARADQFVYAWKLAKNGTGLETITVSVAYPGTTVTTQLSEQITITS